MKAERLIDAFYDSEFGTSGGFVALDFGVMRLDDFFVYELK
jgi:hypothetical protein